jgi:hypothetical protein
MTTMGFADGIRGRHVDEMPASANFAKRQTAAFSHPAQEGPLGTPAISDPMPVPVMNPA